MTIGKTIDSVDRDVVNRKHTEMKQANRPSVTIVPRFMRNEDTPEAVSTGK